MKKIVLSFLAIAGVLTFNACKKSNPAPTNNASVMFVHGCVSGTSNINLDGRANNTTVSGAGNMSFSKPSGYLSVAAGSNVDLSFFVTGLNTLVDQTVSLTANTHYTAFAGGSITAPSFVFTSDDLTAPASGNVKVRFVNLSPDNLTMSCYVGTGTPKIDSNVSYKGCTPFIEIAATTGKIGMIDQATPINSGLITSQTLTAGKIYTFMFTGTATGSGSSGYMLTAITNN